MRRARKTSRVCDASPAGRRMKLTPHPCPSCGATLNSIMGVGLDGSSVDPTPAPGDVTLCADCGGFLRFTHDMQVRAMPFDEVIDLDPAVRNMLFLAHEHWTAWQAKKKAQR